MVVRYKKFIFILLIHIVIIIYVLTTSKKTQEMVRSFKPSAQRTNPSYSDFCQPYRSSDGFSLPHIDERPGEFYAVEEPLSAPVVVVNANATYSDRVAGSLCNAHIVAVVLSAVDHFARRTIIRANWANAEYFNETGIR